MKRFIYNHPVIFVALLIVAGTLVLDHTLRNE
jgi:hypothetical protein